MASKNLTQTSADMVDGEVPDETEIRVKVMPDEYPGVVIADPGNPTVGEKLFAETRLRTFIAGTPKNEVCPWTHIDTTNYPDLADAASGTKLQVFKQVLKSIHDADRARKGLV